MPAIWFIAIPLIALLSTNAANADSVQIIDGTTYRIFGTDAPEFGEKCRDSGTGTWPCGKEAMAKLYASADAGDVSCKTIEEDRYGRKDAECFAGGVNLGKTMVRTAYAWAFVKYTDVYVAEERLARGERVGIWQRESQPAWEYRAKRWEVAEQVAPEGCLIKGNISKHGRIYHAPWSPWYKAHEGQGSKGRMMVLL